MNLAKLLSRQTLLLVGFIGFALGLALIFHFSAKTPTPNSAALLSQPIALPKPESASYGLPVRLKIPGINVDAAVEYVGVTPQGDMGIPKGPSSVAWYNQGPHPGEKGSAVIDGHFGWKDGIPAVFDNLYKLHKGDKLYIEDEKGVSITFTVRESRSYDPKADASTVFRSSDGKAHLNLITCEGAWNTSSKSYSKRLVVFADKE